MPDTDEIFEHEPSEVPDLASRAARPRPFAEVVRVGRRRHRRNQVAVVGGSAVAAVAVIVLALVGANTLDTQPAPGPATSGPTASPTSTATPTAPGTLDTLLALSPEQIVTAEDSTLADLAVSSADPDVRASIWQPSCGAKQCQVERFALAVTDDGFGTTHYVGLKDGAYPMLTAAGGGAFVLVDGSRREVVRGDGTTTAITVGPGRAPVADDEVLVGSFQGSHAYAVDPATATAHRIPAAAVFEVPLAQLPDGRLVVTRADRSGGTYAPSTSVLWSDDGGATWSRHTLQTARSALMSVLPSADPDTMAVVEGLDGATLFPFEQIHYSHDGGRTWQSEEPFPGIDDTAYIGPAFVHTDGSLFAFMDGWSDEHEGKPSSHPYGPYASSAGDLGDLRLTGHDLPGDLGDRPAEVSLRAMTADGSTLFLTGSDARMWSSDDGGDSWTRTPAR